MMMQIGEKYRIESDDLNVTLYCRMNPRKNRSGLSAGWRAIGFFSNVKDALKHLVNLEVMETGMKDLETVVKKQEELFHLIKSLEMPPESAQ